MGKGKRNKQLRVEDTMGAPEKNQNKNKKQFVWPVWAKRALCIALLVAVLAGIIVAAVISSGAVLRGRIIVESKSGKFDMNQQMATFILWQAMYQQGYNEWINDYYQQLYTGSSSSSSSSISKQYQSPDQYAITLASYYTKEALNSGLHSIKDYLIELVAGADAAMLEANMKYAAHDKEDAKSVVTWMKNIYVDLGFAENGIPFKNFLTEYVGDSFKTSDIEDAAKVMVMYSKYSDYKSFELQGVPQDKDLQDYILKNPANFFETKYFSFTGANQSMIRDFFTGEFMTERFESTIAKHYANADRLAIVDLKDAALTAKLEELGLNDAKKYTKTTTDGEVEYSDNLDETVGEYIFSTSNKAGTFAAISGDKCAYLIYFKETSTATEATVAFKKYTYDECKDKIVTDMEDDTLATIEAIKEALNSSIIDGDNTSGQKTDNVKAKELLEQMKKNENFTLPEGLTAEEKDTTKPLEKDDTNTAPKSILDALYAKDATVYAGWKFVVNDSNESYVVKVVEVKKDDEGKDTTNYKISYVKLVDDPFLALLRTFEAEFSLYLLESKVTAPKLNSMIFDDFEKKIVNWLLDENFKELVLTKHANDEYENLKEAMADSGADKLKNTLAKLFVGDEAVRCYEDTYSQEKELDSKVYDYIFNSKNKGTASVIVGKDDRVFLVYVGKDDHKDHNHTSDTTTVSAGIKEYKFETYEADLNVGEGEAVKTYREQILADLLAEGRKNTTKEESADDRAKAELDALKKTENAKTWEEYTSITTTKKDTKKDYQAIISKIYPNGSSATKVDLTVNTYYQVDDNGTSYVFKITEINSETLDCKVEYKSFDDSEYYSYFRAIKSKLDSSFKEKATELKYPSSITSGSYQEWLFDSEYKEAEGDTAASREFKRQNNDLTFIANTDSKNNVTSLTIYFVEKKAEQANDTSKTVYGAYQLFETEKEAQKALKKLNGKTGFELLDLFTSFKHTEEVKEYVSGGHFPGYVNITSPTIGVDLTESGISDKNLKEWFFAADRKAYDVKIIEAKDASGYYLAVFASSDEAWTRSAKNGWVDEAFTNHLKDLIADGGYELNEKAMEKVDGVVTTAAVK